MPYINKGKKKTKPISEDTARKERMKVYNSRLWKSLTDIKKRENPLCEVCLMQNKIKSAEHSHHLQTFTKTKDLALRDSLAYDFDNLISICSECHNRIHHGDLKGCLTKEAIKKRLEELKENKK